MVGYVYFSSLLVASGGGSRLTVDRGSPAIHNGPMGGASPRAGQRRQQAESPDPSAERGRSTTPAVDVSSMTVLILCHCRIMS